MNDIVSEMEYFGTNNRTANFILLLLLLLLLLS